MAKCIPSKLHLFSTTNSVGTYLIVTQKIIVQEISNLIKIMTNSTGVYIFGLYRNYK